MLKIDSDIADFFGSPEAVNQALRLLIDAARTVKFPQAAAETPNAELEPATAAQIFGETDIDDDDVEDSALSVGFWLKRPLMLDAAFHYVGKVLKGRRP